MRQILLFLIFSAVTAQPVDLPPEHDWYAKVVGKQFDLLDNNDDGVLTYDEMVLAGTEEDSNDDGNVTLAEYLAFSQFDADTGGKLFDAYDQDKDGILPDNFMQVDCFRIDKDANGEISLEEYTLYVRFFAHCAFEVQHVDIDEGNYIC